ncbi:MAG: hypothetical protein IPH38_09090 [Candidatus Microthrix sp.]|nr:hypothetical protein [Candidatus Microthrix sp.]MBK7019729.1 hypothetical protein [Candidatus Microthrix sp.]
MSGGVGGGGDVEEFEDLVLLGGEVGLKCLDGVAVGVGEVVAGDTSEDLEDPLG